MADQIRLEAVVMPIILVMNDPNLTWQERQLCGTAITESLRQYHQIMSEQESGNDDEPVESSRRKK